MKKLGKLLRSIVRSVRLAWSFSPGLSMVVLVLTVVLFSIPILQAHIAGQVVNEIVNGLSSAHKVSIGLIIAYGVVWGSSRIIGAFSGFFTKRWNLDVQQGLDIAVLEKRANIDLALYEDPKFQDLLTRAFDRGNWPVLELAEMQFNTVGTIASLVLSSVMMLKYPLIFGAVLVSLIPSFVVDIKFGNRRWFIWAEKSERRRRFSHVRSHLQGRIGVTQAKHLQASERMIAMAREILESFKNDQLSIDRSRLLWNIGASVCVALGFGFSFWTIVGYAQQGRIDIGQIVFMISVLGQFIGSANAFLSGFARQYETALYASDVFEVLDTKPVIQVSASPIPLRLESAPRIEFKNVWFRYEGQDEWVLKDVSFVIEPGERVALVGENGAGKTTLLKLIARTYDPTHGKILVNGVDLRDVLPNEWADHLAVLLQDYRSYEFPVWESIAMGRSMVTPSRTRAMLAAQVVGADDFIERWEDGFDTQLGREFEKGVDPSKGQEQKLAIARTLYRDAFVVVLDEPTASVDALAEEVLVSRLEEAMIAKTLVLVSHRFNTVQNMDRILVFSHGTLVEVGSHAELIKHAGYYERMWRSQAKSYIESESDSLTVN